MTSSLPGWVRGAVVGCCAAAALLLAPARTEAVTFGFDCFTSNGTQPQDCNAGEAQLLMEVGQYDANDPQSIFFYFTNTGGTAMSIADVYFDDDDVFGFDNATFEESSGVDYDEDADPANVPSGNTINFDATWSADANPPAQGNGVNPGEWLRIIFALGGNYTVNDVITALTSGTMRVALHVQGMGTSNSSNGFVNNNTPNDPNIPTVPEPASLLLLGSGLAGVAEATRRRRKAQQQA